MKKYTKQLEKFIIDRIKNVKKDLLYKSINLIRPHINEELLYQERLEEIVTIIINNQEKSSEIYKEFIKDINNGVKTFYVHEVQILESAVEEGCP